MTGPLPGTTRLWGEGGISGLALLVGIAGLVFVESGIRNMSLQSVVNQYLTGKTQPTLPFTVTPLDQVDPSGFGGQAVGGGGALTGQAVADDARKYAGTGTGNGVPYVWGGADPSGWDCSGFVTWVLHHDFGIELPDDQHTVTGQFYVWTGAVTVPRSQMQAGDLVCWLGHIGIALDNTNMVNAPGVGIGTVVQAVYDIPAPVIRRPKAYTNSALSRAV